MSGNQRYKEPPSAGSAGGSRNSPSFAGLHRKRRRRRAARTPAPRQGHVLPPAGWPGATRDGGTVPAALWVPGLLAVMAAYSDALRRFRFVGGPASLLRVAKLVR